MKTYNVIPDPCESRITRESLLAVPSWHRDRVIVRYWEHTVTQDGIRGQRLRTTSAQVSDADSAGDLCAVELWAAGEWYCRVFPWARVLEVMRASPHDELWLDITPEYEV